MFLLAAESWEGGLYLAQASGTLSHARPAGRSDPASRHAAAIPAERSLLMAQRTQVEFTDDIDGSDAAGTVRFGQAGASYEVVSAR